MSTLTRLDFSDAERKHALQVPELIEAQRALLDHSQRFSERLHGAALLDNHELAKRRGDEEAEAGYHGELEDWAAAEAAADRRIDSPDQPVGTTLYVTSAFSAAAERSG